MDERTDDIVEREFADVHRYPALLMKRESFPQDSPPVVNTLMYFAYMVNSTSYKQDLNACFVK